MADTFDTFLCVKEMFGKRDESKKSKKEEKGKVGASDHGSDKKKSESVATLSATLTMVPQNLNIFNKLF